MVNHPPPPNIPGIRAEGDLLRTLRSEVASLLSRDNTRFPGAQPVSFAARHLIELQQQDYFVCEKSDGIRCLMYLTHDGDNEVTYLIDRKNDYYWVQGLHFPLPESERSFHTGAVVDGELVNDRELDGSTQLKYLVFDCLTLSYSALISRTLDKRLAYYRDKIYDPYFSLYERYPEEKRFLPFIVQFKGMEKAYGIEKILRITLPNLPHGSDGLIFTCRKTPYKFGTDPHILKWKPAHENSVDFRLVLELSSNEHNSIPGQSGETENALDWTVMPIFHLYVGGDGNSNIAFGQMFLSSSEWENLKEANEPLDERIVECYQDTSHRWRFMRFRDDKNEPNHISTVDSVMESIEDRIGERELIATQNQIRDAWKAREAAEAASAHKGSFPPSTVPVNTGNGSAAIGQRNNNLSQKRKRVDAESGNDSEGTNKKTTSPSAMLATTYLGP